MKDFKKWIYHGTEEPKIINSSELKEWISKGWQESPAAFIKLSDFGLDKEKTAVNDPEECAKAQQVLDSLEGVVDSINGALNIDIMSKEQLKIYADKHFSLELNTKRKLKDLRAQVKAHIEA